MTKFLWSTATAGFLLGFAVVLSCLEPSVAQTRQSSSGESYRVQQGSGGYEDRQTGRGESYRYEVWSNRMNTQYTLRVWKLENYPNGYYSSRQFRSGREALDYFDCFYARKRLPSCPYN